MVPFFGSRPTLERMRGRPSESPSPSRPMASCSPGHSQASSTTWLTQIPKANRLVTLPAVFRPASYLSAQSLNLEWTLERPKCTGAGYFDQPSHRSRSGSPGPVAKVSRLSTGAQLAVQDIKREESSLRFCDAAVILPPVTASGPQHSLGTEERGFAVAES